MLLCSGGSALSEPEKRGEERPSREERRDVDRRRAAVAGAKWRCVSVIVSKFLKKKIKPTSAPKTKVMLLLSLLNKKKKKLI